MHTVATQVQTPCSASAHFYDHQAEPVFRCERQGNLCCS